MNRKIAQYGFVAVLFVGLFFEYQYHQILPKFPQTVHQWRQCDGAAIAMMYVHNGMNFFEPGVYNLHGNGKTVAEFPIIYYIDAVLIQLFGQQHNHAIIRLVNLLIFYLGALYLFKIGLLVFKKWWWAVFPSVLFSTFPIVTYYAATSVPDVPALSLLFVGLYYWFQYIKEKRIIWLITAILVISLVGMIKSTMLIAYLAFVGVLFTNHIFRLKKIRLQPIIFFYFFIPLIATFGWIYWAGAYSAANENVTFLMNIKPIWGIDRAFIDEISKRIKVNWIYEYIYLPLLWMVAIFGLVFLVYPKKEWRLLKFGIVLLLVGTAAYFYLFFEQFYHHDYYAIALLPLILVLYIAILYSIEQIVIPKWTIHFVSAVNIVMLLFCIQYAGINIHKRYTADAQYNNYNDVYSEIAPILRANGVKYSDKVIVSSDNSPNISLYLMDQLGWTRFPYGLDEENVKEYIQAEAQYLITTEEDFTARPYLAPFLKDTLFEYKNVLAFIL